MAHTLEGIRPEDIRAHFTARAPTYDASSHWCTDPHLAERTRVLLAADSTHDVLDVACGTGLVSRLFHGRVARLTGLDATAAMAEQGSPHLDELVLGSAMEMPFPDGSFDRIVCRQGIQFMDDAKAVSEMVRVLRPGGRVLLVHLCAYGAEDRDEYFEILRLRNPARRNFYLREDLEGLLRKAGCSEVAVMDHISVEDVDAWSDNGAIEDTRRAGIRDVYRNASPAFRALHAVRSESGDRYFDHMLFGMAIGVKPG